MCGALNITVTGRVQGVGFRPFIFALADKYHLKGTAQNNLDGVIIHAEGDSGQLKNMIEEMQQSPPRLAKINQITVRETARKGYTDFTIISSDNKGNGIPWMPADAAICHDCKTEMDDPSNHRYQFPFINCTQCGPRYTIIRDVPYDRPYTTMKEFTMCPRCYEEYGDPKNRRHHAQPTCCPACGPVLALYDHNGSCLNINTQAKKMTLDFLKKGKIVALKGIGGYHLACDPFQPQTVARLRQLKRRPTRPLAVMMTSIDCAKQYCWITKQEEERLLSPEMPIVILQKKEGVAIPDVISPGLTTLGVMLPYTPLHHLLLDAELPCLVMTSANTSGLPICYKDDPVLDDLKNLADYVLTHNRPIHRPVDDSVVQCDGDETFFVRRGRGYMPEPLKTTGNVDQIIALGGDQKSAYAIGKHQHIYLSPHVGDVENEEMIHFLEDHIRHEQEWLHSESTCVAFDKHPLYETAKIAQTMLGEKISVQHHHAHHVSCMEDNALEEDCLGIILDGTGFGEDGHVWGFEFLYGNARSVTRLGHLTYTPLPGGDRAVKQPWRTAVGMLLHYWPEEGERIAAELFPDRRKEINVISQMVVNDINSPLAGTCGRLFDAVSAILGICSVSTYEGEAAMKLADGLGGTDFPDDDEKTYPYRITSNDHGYELDVSAMILAIIQEKCQGRSIQEISRRFHQTVVSCCVHMTLAIAAKRPELNRSVVLSGGSFQNNYLRKHLQRHLEKRDFQVYTHKQVPCHDGGLALGQMIIASAARQQRSRAKTREIKKKS
ncbi:carbamoyltransferase HypF [Salipaludibacillus keqinensis]|uniref:Carbamoyltransferase n=1 Tax=Salipaludibacillus keqinensis TaxID=2045207 RepID=A0A323TMD7_9BACI|nr:carbamoyltransferase HypF [Salipaludibacillus keqinensis]PYZ94807.1 carbamoyltransferase HypF [Salipaludibacillus keqinensis]